MDIIQLIEAVDRAGKIKPVRVKDLKSSARQYIKLLGYDDPKFCPQGTYLLPKPQRDELLVQKLPGASAIKVRNLKNNLSFLFRQAEELGLVRIQKIQRLKPVVSLHRLYKQQSLQPQGFKICGDGKYRLPYEEWPQELQHAFEEWAHWATAEFVPGRSASRKVRTVTVEARRYDCETFFGYLRNIRGLKQLTFQMVIDVDLVTNCVEWHVNERCSRVTRFILNLLASFQSLARSYFGNEESALALKRLKAELGQPPRVIDKRQRMVAVADLISVGISEFPRKNQLLQLNSRGGSGKKLANRAGRAVAILLLATRPLRNKNYREAQLGSGQHIYKTGDGKWVLDFTGSEGLASLKRKRTHDGTLNSYYCEVPDFVAPYLEEYVEFWRPMLTRNTPSTYLFLSYQDQPYSAIGFSDWIQRATLKWLGKRVNPHLFRDIVATEMINETESYTAAAAMLNDDPQTVFRHYWHLNQRRAVQVTDQWLNKKLSVSSSLMPSFHKSGGKELSL